LRMRAFCWSNSASVRTPAFFRLAEFGGIGLAGIARGVLDDELRVQDADGALGDEGQQFPEIRRADPSVRKLDREEIDRADFILAWLVFAGPHVPIVR
jgi:hypothetical protein